MKKKIRVTIGLLLLIPFVSWGQFSLSGTVITQTGTASDLSGLASVSSVTVTTEGSGNNERKIYTLDGVRLEYDQLTIDPRVEELVFKENCPVPNFSPVSSSANLTVGVTETVNGEEYGTNLPAITCYGKEGNVWQTAGSVYIPHGVFNWNAGTIRVTQPFGITSNSGFAGGGTSDATGRIKRFATLEILGRINNTEEAQMSFGLKEDFYVEGLRVIGHDHGQTPSNALISIGHPPKHAPEFELIGMGGISYQGNDRATTILELRGFKGAALKKGVNLFSGSLILSTNSILGSATIVTEHNTANHQSSGLVEGRQEVEFDVFDKNTGNAIDGALVFMRDTDNGDRRNYSATYSYTADRTYSTTTSSTGKAEFKTDGGILTWVVAKSQPSYLGINDSGVNKKDRRGLDDTTDDKFKFFIFNYGHEITETTLTLKADNEVVSYRADVFSDANITESTKATVDAYAKINDLDMLYDRAKSWKVSSTNLEHPSLGVLLATPDGTKLDLGSHNLIIDKNAASAFEVNKASSTITIKSDALVMGDKFTSITTSGTISTANSATIEFGYEDSTGINKFVHLDWNQSITENVSVINLDNTSSPIINKASALQTYKGHFVMPNPAPTNGIRVEIETPGGFRVFQEGFPNSDLNFVRLNVTLNASEERQGEMLFLARKLLQKTEGINEALTGTTPSITDSTTTTTTGAAATNENQVAILQLLRRILNKVTANKEALQKE